MDLVRAADRFRTSQPGIESWSVLSTGPHYDADRLQAGPILSLDEHVLAPGAAFADHAHGGVTIVSWVVEGVLEHRGDSTLLIEPGTVLVQHTGRGIRHEERNASSTDALRLIQTTLAADPTDAPATALATPPVEVDGARLSIEPVAPAWVYVLDGSWRGLAPGDFAWVTEPPEGVGALLAWCVPSQSWTQSISGV